MKTVKLTKKEIELLEDLYGYLNELDFEQIYFDEDDNKMEKNVDKMMGVWDKIMKKVRK